MRTLRSLPSRDLSLDVSPGSRAFVLATFTVALFLSAILLFVVQPMFAKMVLPRLGGSPAVWSLAMCFFQLALLGGYAYAHGLIRLVRPERGVVIHLGLMALALLALPIGIAAAWNYPPEEGLHLWVIGLFAASIGLPFFALSGNAPLLQAWFARSGHPHGRDPYFLYGASNVGSLLALLGYPLVIEPYAALGAQSAVWTLGFKALLFLVGASALLMILRAGGRETSTEMESDTAPTVARGRITARDRVVWTGLAFVPSGLLVAVTAHITTDVAAAPFLWVLPLALFLLTFVITFQRRPVLAHAHMIAIQPVVVALLIVSMQFPLSGYWLALLLLHLGTFFVSTMVCHGELVRRRPEAGDLTEFYLFMSLGGALGGLFTGLIAPQIFDTVAEYPLMIVAALLVRPGFWTGPARRFAREFALAAGLVAIAVVPKLVLGIEVIEKLPDYYIALFTAAAILMILARPNALRLASFAAATMIVGHVLMPEDVKGENDRGFFGVNKVVVTPDKAHRLLIHGTTLHGVERLSTKDVDTTPEPLTYYHDSGPFADVIRKARGDGTLDQVAVIGLGAGSLACYAMPGETWTFFEIDPIVVRIAKDPKNFTFLSKCAPEARVVVGDARLTLTREPDNRFDLLIVDAFSSDAIPVHLLTREAIAGYFAKLSDDGVVAIHISNRNMNLAPVIASLATDLGLTAFRRHGGHAGKLKDSYKSAATVIALARKEAHLRDLPATDGWKPLPKSNWRVWTDDYSNVLQAILAGASDNEARPSKQ